MRQIRRRTALLAAAALCWGIMFPEYVFTPDSYTAFWYEESDSLIAGVTDEMAEGLVQNGAQVTENLQSAEDIQDLYAAVKEGKVRYRIGFIEYLKNYLFGT